MTQAMPQSKVDTGEAARQVGSDAMQKAGDVAATAGAEMRAVVGEAKERAHDMLAETREKFRAEADTQSHRVAAAMRDLGGQLEAMARGQATEGWIPELSRRAAGTLTKTASQIDEGGPEAALADLKNFARRRPGMFLAGALGVGFVVGRAIRAADTKALVAAAKDDGGDSSPAQTPRQIEPPRPAMANAPTRTSVDLTAEAWQ